VLSTVYALFQAFAISYVDALLIIGLPNGPTAHFKLSNLVLRKDIKNHGNPTSHQPELVLNNFTTRLGNRVGRFFQSLFPPDPNFRGRRVVTFHNQRDFIFFRHHRYITSPFLLRVAFAPFSNKTFY
jgi:ribosome production factor 1